jgi:hypothetical protein
MFELDDDIFDDVISDDGIEDTSEYYIGLASLPEFKNEDIKIVPLAREIPETYKPLTSIEIIKRFPALKCKAYKFNNISLKIAHKILPREYILTLLNTNLQDIGIKSFTGITNELLIHYVDDIKEIDIFLSYAEYYIPKLPKIINVYIPIEHLVLPSIRKYIVNWFHNITNLLELFVELSTNKLYDSDENCNILNTMYVIHTENIRDYVELVIESEYITKCAFNVALRYSDRVYMSSISKIIQKFGNVINKN